MAPFQSSLHELDVPVENLFFIDQLLASEQAIHLLNYRLQGAWPVTDLMAGLQAPRPLGAWAAGVGYAADDVLPLHALSLVDRKPLFRARMTTYYGHHSPGWVSYRLREDFAEIARPGEGGILFGVEDDPASRGQTLSLYGYLVAVKLHAHAANARLQLLEEENIALWGDMAVVGGWLTADSLSDSAPGENASEH